MLVYMLLTESIDQPFVDIVLGCGPSRKGGLSESAYTKRYLLDHFDQLADFPRLRPLLKKLDKSEMSKLCSRLESIIETPVIKNTSAEVAEAAKIFRKKDIQKAVQISSASHVPRCLQVQSQAREAGIIPKDQLWSTVADDSCYAGSDASTTLILEKPHRGDDPMLGMEPSLPEVLRKYLVLGPNSKRDFIAKCAEILNEK